MKISSQLLASIVLGITVTSAVVSCQKDEVKSGNAQKQKEKKEKPVENTCFACGMG